MSSPPRVARTKAGLFLADDKSVNGKETTTISPATNLSMLPHPQEKANPL